MNQEKKWHISGRKIFFLTLIWFWNLKRKYKKEHADNVAFPWIQMARSGNYDYLIEDIVEENVNLFSLNLLKIYDIAGKSSYGIITVFFTQYF